LQPQGNEAAAANTPAAEAVPAANAEGQANAAHVPPEDDGARRRGRRQRGPRRASSHVARAQDLLEGFRWVNSWTPYWVQRLATSIYKYCGVTCAKKRKNKRL
jgi:hypothetical protein